MISKQVLRVVVASPGDLKDEREALPKVIDDLNRGLAAERGLILELIKWETHSHPGVHPNGPQGLIDPSLRIWDCDLFIGILWTRFGTPTPNGMTGTEHEFHQAYNAWQEGGRPQIFFYFNETTFEPASTEEEEQYEKVRTFKDRMPEETFCWKYTREENFGQLVHRHLTNFLRDRPRQPILTRPTSELIAWAVTITVVVGALLLGNFPTMTNKKVPERQGNIDREAANLESTGKESPLPGNEVVNGSDQPHIGSRNRTAPNTTTNAEGLISNSETSDATPLAGVPPTPSSPPQTIIDSAGVGDNLSQEDETPSGLDTEPEHTRQALDSQYREPTQTQMREAVLRSSELRGGRRIRKDGVSFDNVLNGWAYDVLEFEKLGCTVATKGAGYECSYLVKSSISAHSNEGTASGDQHAQAVNTLLKLLSGGNNTPTEVLHKRFLLSQQGWLVSD